ncbi:MAG: cysteine-rich small domain-containing protein [Clostridia bacterium]|nr:cysteine-rich small domain-containing protein [Clostridia bacterium]
MKNNCKYYKNTECEYFPCHENAGEDFNCMFCFCPLYPLGDKCGGNFEYIDDKVKNCSNCLIPHSKDGYEYISKKLREVSEIAKNNREQQGD